MLRARDLSLLRSEVAAVLRRLQELPGFAESLEALPRLPDEHCHWAWHHLLRVLHGDVPGSVQWQWLPAAEVDPTLARQARQVDGHSEATDEGEVLRVPVPEAAPIAPEQLEEYREAVVSFAHRYVLAADWSPRAVHTALRAGERIRLPAAPPRPALSVPADLRLDHKAEDPLSAETVALLLQALQGAGDHPATRTYRRERHELDLEVVETLKAAAVQRPELGPLADRFAKLQALYAEVEDLPERRLEPHRRDAMWEGAVEHVRLRLAGERPTNKTPSSYASRAKDYLNAAVNGSFNSPIPADPFDSPDYFIRWRPLLVDAAKALHAWRELSESSGT